jgi:hypothetical protein
MEGDKLKGQVAVVLDDEYEEESNRDKKFNDSKNACRSLLQGLQNISSEIATKISDTIARIEGVCLPLPLCFSMAKKLYSCD